ncbi:hypothetical protein PVK06_017788 [Gossypium arboreum]|uniref:Uncharacterized protein n=1 Tax=Gossypium arboreum TaxID=29729 RepID=A0ABR0Q408_GOSAR|nr:hypothetical protein PVK06_017788 [Gossypium arboreum]
MMQAHQQHPHNHQAQQFNRRHLHHSFFRLCQVRILALICFIFLVLWQVGIYGPVHLRSRLLRVNRHSIGRSRMRDRTRRHQRALLSTNPYHLTGFKHLRHG